MNSHKFKNTLLIAFNISVIYEIVMAFHLDLMGFTFTYGDFAIVLVSTISVGGSCAVITWFKSGPISGIISSILGALIILALCIEYPGAVSSTPFLLCSGMGLCVGFSATLLGYKWYTGVFSCNQPSDDKPATEG